MQCVISSDLYLKEQQTMFRKQKIAIAYLIMAASLLTGCFKSQNVVTKVRRTDGKALTLNGVSYALPRTVIQVAIPINRKEVAPGEYESFAPCFFPKDLADNRVLEKKVEFRVNPPA